jgi:hypothetical protein
LCDLPDATAIARKPHRPRGALSSRQRRAAGADQRLGNTAPRAIEESFGIMVNYLYDHKSIEDNHEAFVRDGTIVRSPDVDALMQEPA